MKNRKKLRKLEKLKKIQLASFLIMLNSLPKKSSVGNLFLQYFQLWSPFQWVTSIFTLLITYWISGYFYNKYLSKKGGWMDWKTRVAMIGADLIANFSVGAYYMNHRDTFLGALMVQCPIFLSPCFWIFEIICFYIYCRYISYKKDKQKL